MNILLVENDEAKRAEVYSLLLTKAGVSRAEIRCVSDAEAACEAMERQKFDVLILDLHLPKSPDKPSEAAGGTFIIEWLEASDCFHPNILIGLSANADAMELSKDRFTASAWKLIKFDEREMAWEAPLIDSIAYARTLSKESVFGDGVTYRSDIGIVVALEEVEFKAVEQRFGRWEEPDPPVPFPTSKWRKGKLVVNSRELDAVVVACPNMGMPLSAAITSALLFYFRPKLALLLGICAGKNEKTHVGDIIVGDPCWDWGSGKIEQRPAEKPEFHPSPWPRRLDEELRTIVEELTSNQAMLSDIRAQFQGTAPAEALSAAIGPVACGAAVVASEETTKRIETQQHREYLAIDMESFGFMTAVDYGPAPRAKGIVIKSVCDFGIFPKPKGHQPYAAYTSAAFAMKLIEKLEKKTFFK